MPRDLVSLLSSRPRHAFHGERPEDWEKITRPDKADSAAQYPAARCRACARVTWVCSLKAGIRPLTDSHVPGCQAPAGRIELRARIGDPTLEAELVGDALRICLSDFELERVETFLLGALA